MTAESRVFPKPRGESPLRACEAEDRNMAEEATNIISESPALTEDQQRALQTLQAGVSVFLTGYAGTGKSFLLEQFSVWAAQQEPPRRILRTASTGAAAQNIGGRTIHSTLNWTRRCQDRALDAEEFSKRAALLRQYDVLVVDEISMLTPGFFRYLCGCLGTVSGLQLIFIGDFFQLPPVKAEYIIGMPEWDALGLKPIHLTTVVRQQGDGEFSRLLDGVRAGKAEAFDRIKAACAKQAQQNALNLCARAETAREINRLAMAQLPGEAVTYRATLSEERNDVKWPNATFERELTLKRGMQVILTANSRLCGFLNGSLGTLTELARPVPGGGEEALSVRLAGKKNVTVSVLRHTIEVETENEDTVLVKQFPLLPAYAITIHKSQGMSCDRVNLIDGRCWEYGQLYVALSRARSLEGLYIAPDVRPSGLRTSPEVYAFYQRLFPQLYREPLPAASPADAQDETPWWQKLLNRSLPDTKKKRLPEQALQAVFRVVAPALSGQPVPELDGSLRAFLRALLGRRDVLTVSSEEGTACVQAAALLQPGLTVVVIPSVQAIRLQLSRLGKLGIPASGLTSEFCCDAGRMYEFETAADTPQLAENRRMLRDRILLGAAAGSCRLLYLTPERLQSGAVRRLFRHADVARFVVDKAQVLSPRSGVLRIRDAEALCALRELRDRPPVAVMAAYAHEGVRDDLIRLLGLKHPLLIDDAAPEAEPAQPDAQEESICDPLALLSAAEPWLPETQIDALLANRTKVARLLRKGQMEGKDIPVGDQSRIARALRRRKAQNTPKDGDRTASVSYRVEGEKLSYFDLMAADAVYTLLCHGYSRICPRQVMAVLSGLEGLTLRPERKEAVEESLLRLSRAQISIDRSGSMDIGCAYPDEREATLLSGPFLPLTRESGGFRRIPGAWPPLYQYAEIMNGQFHALAARDLRAIFGSGQRKDAPGGLPASTVNLALAHALLLRLDMIPNEYRKGTTRSVTSRTIRLDHLAETAQIPLPPEEKARARKLGALREKTVRILRCLEQTGTICGFEILEEQRFRIRRW